MREPVIGVFGWGHVHERDLRSSRFDGGAATGHARQRLAAERSTKVTKENEQHGAALLHLVQWRRQLYAVVTAVCAHRSSFRASSLKRRMPSLNFSTAI